MFTKEMVDKIDKFLHKNLDIMFNFEFNGMLLLWGGAIKSLIMDTSIRDFDFVLLTNDNDNVADFVKKFNLTCQDNFGHGYSFEYNGFSVGLSIKNDLSNVGLNTDLLFYDVHRKMFIPIGIKQAIKNKQVIFLTYYGYPSLRKRIRMKQRLKSAKKFIQFMNCNSKKVKIIGNFKYGFLLLLGFLKKPSKIIKIFRR